MVCEERGVVDSKSLTWATGCKQVVGFTNQETLKGYQYVDRVGHEFSLAMLKLKCQWDSQIGMTFKQLRYESRVWERRLDWKYRLQSAQSRMAAKYWSHENRGGHLGRQ